MRVTEVALATSVPPGMRRPGPGGADAGPAWRSTCASSWPAPGWRVLSVNPAEEVDRLADLPPGIEATAAQPGVAETFGRPGTWVGDALGRAIATGAPVVGLINADIRLDLDARRRAALAGRARTRLVACNRMDIGHPGQVEGPFYRYGYDLLLMPRELAMAIDMRGFALGVPWWDYWFLLDALLQRMPVEVVQCRGVAHLAHKAAWQRPAWMAALRGMMGHIAPRRAAVSSLGMGTIAEATVDMLAAVAAAPEEGYPLSEIAETAGTRFGIEVVRLAERNAWTLE
jgi:hypothetical protein